MDQTTVDGDRFRWIYEPSGPAREYAPLAGNFRRGCGHGCKYCYCPGQQRMKREEFHQPNVPTLQKFSLENAEHDLALMAEAGDERPVHLCFIGDPFDRTCDNSRIMYPLLKMFADYGFRPQILTKNGLFALGAYGDEMQAADAIFGQTIIFSDEESRETWEPGASELLYRWTAFKRAQDRFLRTWLSIEPVIDPQQALEVIARALDEGTVDEIRVGKWNHDKRAKEIDWAGFAKSAENFLWSSGVDWLIKRDLAEHLPPDAWVMASGHNLWHRAALYPDLGGGDDE